MGAPVNATLRQIAIRHRAYMLDECIISRLVQGGQNVYGTPAEEWVDGEPITCSFKTNTAKEVQGTAQVDAADAVLRLPPNTEIDAGYRVRITRRMRTDLETPLHYDVSGEIERGKFGIVVPLKRRMRSDHA